MRILLVEDDERLARNLMEALGGAGVPDDALASLAGRGVRLDETVPGHGLGLAIARDIAMACGGTLLISNREGGGFQVTVELPCQQKSKRHA